MGQQGVSMWVIGILGGICSGKTTVSQEFGRLGAEVFDADAVVHQLLERSDVLEEIVTCLGESILDESGRISRKALAGVVFGEGKAAGEKRKQLEKLLHPRARAAAEERLQEYQRQNGELFVIDAPLLLEANWTTLCHRLVYVDVPSEIRYYRAQGRGFDAAAVRARENSQFSPEQKRLRADFVISNSGNLMELRGQVGQLWGRLRTDSHNPLSLH